jgi:hypothetical protein
MNLERIGTDFETNPHYKRKTNLEGAKCDQKFSEKISIQIGHENVMSLQ